MKTFSFNENIPFLFDPAAFFRKNFYLNSRDALKRSHEKFPGSDL